MRLALGAELDGEDLVQLNDVAFEAQSRPGHVETPDTCGAFTDLGDAGIPVVDEVLAPSGEGECVVLAQILLVPHLESDVLDFGDDASGAGEFAVGEDVPVDEAACACLTLVVGPGDAVVQQPAASRSLLCSSPK